MTKLFNDNCRKVISPLACFGLFIIATSFTLFSAHPIYKGNWIPEGFHLKDGILLIQEHPFGEKQNDRMIEFLEKEYHWRYEVVSIKQMQENKKYQDKKLYPFALLWSDVLAKEITTDPHGFTYHDIDGHFLDRIANNEYPLSKHGKGYGQIGYRKVINALNKKFKSSE